jgi:hypothetical protein
MPSGDKNAYLKSASHKNFLVNDCPIAFSHPAHDIFAHL